MLQVGLDGIPQWSASGQEHAHCLACMFNVPPVETFQDAGKALVMWPASCTSFIYAHANLLPKKQKGIDRKVYTGRRALREALDRPMVPSP